MNRLYTCWDRWGRVEGILWMSGAIVGDVLITGLLVAGTAALTGSGPLLDIALGPLALLLLLSAGTSLLLEWAARRLDLWRYHPAMPTIHLLGLEVGLSPLLQVSLLPAASLALTQIVGGGPMRTL